MSLLQCYYCLDVDKKTVKLGSSPVILAFGLVNFVAGECFLLRLTADKHHCISQFSFSQLSLRMHTNVRAFIIMTPKEKAVEQLESAVRNFKIIN